MTSTLQGHSTRTLTVRAEPPIGTTLAAFTSSAIAFNVAPLWPDGPVNVNKWVYVGETVDVSVGPMPADLPSAGSFLIHRYELYNAL